MNFTIDVNIKASPELIEVLRSLVGAPKAAAPVRVAEQVPMPQPAPVAAPVPAPTAQVPAPAATPEQPAPVPTTQQTYTSSDSSMADNDGVPVESKTPVSVVQIPLWPIMTS